MMRLEVRKPAERERLLAAGLHVPEQHLQPEGHLRLAEPLQLADRRLHRHHALHRRQRGPSAIIP
jgi:hypothetical protein